LRARPRLGPMYDAVDTVRSGLSALARIHALGDGPHTLLLALHVLNGASTVRSESAYRRQRFVVGFWIVFFACFGGSFTSSLLIQRPDLVANPAFKDVRVLPFTLLAWYFTQYTQLGGWLAQSKLFGGVSRLASTFNRGRNICRVTEVAVKLYPGVYGASLLLGTLAGTGGRLWSEYILHHLGDLKRPSEITLPSFVLRSGLLGAVIYLASVHLLPSDFSLAPDEGKALVATTLLLQAVVSLALGRELDPTAHLSDTFHAVTKIPRLDAAGKQEDGAADDKGTNSDDSSGRPPRHSRTPESDAKPQAQAFAKRKTRSSLRSKKNK